MIKKEMKLIKSQKTPTIFLFMESEVEFFQEKAPAVISQKIKTARRHVASLDHCMFPAE